MCRLDVIDCVVWICIKAINHAHALCILLGCEMSHRTLSLRFVSQFPLRVDNAVRCTKVDGPVEVAGKCEVLWRD